MSEQLAFQQPRGNGGAIHLDKAGAAALAHAVDGAGDQLLTCAGFTQNQDGSVAGRNRLSLLQHALQRLAFSNDFLEV